MKKLVKFAEIFFYSLNPKTSWVTRGAMVSVVCNFLSTVQLQQEIFLWVRKKRAKEICPYQIVIVPSLTFDF